MKNFRLFLEKINFHLLVKYAVGINYFTNPFPLPGFIKINISDFSSRNKKIIHFLLLGEALIKRDLEEIMNENAFQDLVSNDLIYDDGFSYSLKGCIVTSYFGNYVIADSPYYYENAINKFDDVYLGSDSSILSSILLNKKCQSALDLCSGSGVQSIILSRNSKRVESVDINKKAIKYSKINYLLNSIENITIEEKDIFTTFEKKYDLIVSNPPFIPIVPAMKYYSIAGAGGIFGYDKIMRILHIAQQSLTNNGELIISGEGLGIDGKLLLEKIIKEESKLSLSIKLYVLDEMDINKFIENLGIFCKSAYKDDYEDKHLKELEKACKENNYNTYHRFLLFATKNNEHQKTFIETNYFFQHIDVEDEFELTIPLNKLLFLKNETSYIVNYGNRSIISVDEELKNLLEKNEFSFKGILNQNEQSDIYQTINQLLKSKIIKRKEN